MSKPSRPQAPLTLAQVRQAGLFAWREDQCLYVDERLLRVHLRSANEMQVTESVLGSCDDSPYQNRWHHLPDCACLFHAS